MRIGTISFLCSAIVVMAQFKPEIANVTVGTRLLQPGDSTLLTIDYVNRGTDVAPKDYRAFVHVEDAELKCDGGIRGHHDHELAEPPTSAWEPGKTITVGPIRIGVPANCKPGKYLVHFGIFDVENGKRLVDSYAGGEIMIDPDAPKNVLKAPEPLPAAEIAKRRAATAARLEGAPYAIETADFRFRLHRDGSCYDLLDKRGGALWSSNPVAFAFGPISYNDADGKRHTVEINHFDSITQRDGGIRLQLAVEPELTVALDISVCKEPVTGLRFGVVSAGRLGATAQVTMFNKSFACSNSDNGATVVPYRTGERFDTMHSRAPFFRPWTTYCWDSTMAMFGQEKDGCALLIDWNHPHSSYVFSSVWTQSPKQPGTVVNTISLTLQPGATECFVRPLGKGSYQDIAKAYRQVAMKRGLVKTWSDKKKDTGNAVDNMHGAADFKPFVFSRSLATSRYNKTGKEQTHVGYKLDDISQITEHLHDDLGIDKAMMVLAGWIHRGYDNQHPDPLPVAPELGGNDELVKTSKRVRDTGFLFGLHDNYQDMYRDAPSWNPDFVGKNADGSLMAGGNWAGGPCWLVCAEKQLELAMRPDTNLPKIHALFNPTIYFIDTIFAAPLYSCHDPKHPETHADDMAYKTRLCQYARSHFGLFGSEEGREWAVPYADYMEGIFGHRANIRTPGSSFHSHLGGDLIPLFEMVYGDCVNLYTHQSDRAIPGRDSYITACISHAENPLYDFGNGLYFKAKVSEVPLSLDVPSIEQLGDRRFRVTYTWHVLADMDRQLKAFVHYTHDRGEKDREGIAFQDDHNLVSEPKKKGDVITVTREIRVPEQFNDAIGWRIGTFDAKTFQRQNFTGVRHHGTTNDSLGTLSVNERNQIVYHAENISDNRSDFSRNENGWGEEHHLSNTDSFIKNTYEVVSWVSRLAANSPMTDHRFLNDERDAEYTAFDDMHIYVNQSKQDFTVTADEIVNLSAGAPVVLPTDGFIVVSPRFIAMHVKAFGGLDYKAPVLFTFRALDGKPLAASARIRIYHGFGEQTVRLLGRTFTVTGEAVK